MPSTQELDDLLDTQIEQLSLEIKKIVHRYEVACREECAFFIDQIVKLERARSIYEFKIPKE